MSPMLSSGLVGVSIHTDFVRPGTIAARTASTSLTGAELYSSPHGGHLVDQPVGAAVRVVGDHHVVAGVADRPQQGVLGSQPGGEREPALPLLQGRDVALERSAGGVAGAAVLVAAAHPADTVLLVGGGGVDGRDHRAGHRRPARSRHGWRGSRSPIVAVFLGHRARLLAAGARATAHVVQLHGSPRLTVACPARSGRLVPAQAEETSPLDPVIGVLPAGRSPTRRTTDPVCTDGDPRASTT